MRAFRDDAVESAKRTILIVGIAFVCAVLALHPTNTSAVAISLIAAAAGTWAIQLGRHIVHYLDLMMVLTALAMPQAQRTRFIASSVNIKSKVM
jgi:hypothetical protein